MGLRRGTIRSGHTMMKDTKKSQGADMNPVAKMSRAFGRAWRRLAGAADPDLMALRKDVDAMAGSVRETERAVRLANQGIQAVIRKLYLDPSELDQPYALLSQRFGLLSQNSEDGLTWAIFKLAGVTNRRFVEIGSGVNGGNSGFLAAECGWTGLMVDSDPDRVAHIRSRFGPGVTAVARLITRENINTTVEEFGLAGDIDLFSLDIDGIDYWVWEALAACAPRLVIVEYNADFGPDRPVVVPYSPTFRRSKKTDLRYYGASLAAFVRLAGQKGYRLVLTEPRGVNAYFLRNDVCPALGGIPPAAVFVGASSAESEALSASLSRLQLPLVDLDG